MLRLEYCRKPWKYLNKQMVIFVKGSLLIILQIDFNIFLN